MAVTSTTTIMTTTTTMRKEEDSEEVSTCSSSLDSHHGPLIVVQDHLHAEDEVEIHLHDHHHGDDDDSSVDSHDSDHAHPNKLQNSSNTAPANPTSIDRRATLHHSSIIGHSTLDLSAALDSLQTLLIPTEIIETKPTTKHVSFDDHVLVHYYKLILGDNPSVSNGVPLTLDVRNVASKIELLHDERPHAPEDDINPSHKIRAFKYTTSQRYRVALANASKSQIAKVLKEVSKLQESLKKSQDDNVELLLLQQHPQRTAAVPRKRRFLWSSHRR